MDNWLSKHTSYQNRKNNQKALDLRNIGNKFFLKKNYNKCYYYYTKSLCYASFKDEDYGIALANRSALFYDQQDYEASGFVSNFILILINF